MNRGIIKIFFCFFFFIGLLLPTVLFAQVPADSIKKIDSAAVNPPVAPPAEKAQTSSSESQSVLLMEFVKSKTEHSPDSTFFNILKITNNNGKVVQGRVKISVPAGWHVISETERPVSISPGQTEYIPVRVSLARRSTGGTSYVITASLVSDRSLFSDKNQNSVSKTCYVTIPKKVNWSVYPVSRTVYFDRYSESAPLQLKVSNKGNGYQFIKLELAIGGALEMYGAVSGRFFTSVELKPHRDTILTFPIKRVSVNAYDSRSRDFENMTVRIRSVSDSSIRRTSVNFKYLESYFENQLGDKQSPLVVEAQVQNLLSDYQPTVLFSAYGDIFFKNDHTLDYFLRIPGIVFYSYNKNVTISDALWQRSRMRVKYTTDKWQVFAGDISSGGMSMLGTAGRGIGGSYNISTNQKIGAAFAKSVVSPVYSGNLHHDIGLRNGLGLNSGVSFIVDEYNKIGTYSAFGRASYSPALGHKVALLVAGSQVQHTYNDQTFTDAAGNFIITNNPNATFYGFAAHLQYQMKLKRARASLNAGYVSKHFSQYENGRLQFSGQGQYTINKKYYISSIGHLNQHAPQHYNLGILRPEKKILTGKYKIELADIVNSRLTLFAGPYFDHVSMRTLRISAAGDSIYARFRSLSPQLSTRLTYRGRISSVVSPHMILGYTYVYSALDSSVSVQSPETRREFFKARAGVNIIQKYWGVNVSYDYGPHDIISQTEYYYFNSYSKSLRVSPYYERFFLNRTMLFSSHNSYAYEALSNSERISLNGRFTFFLDYDWTFFVDNNLFSFSRINSEGARIFTRKFHLSLGVKKVFDIPQPGIKYYDMKVVCFKDMNGNKIMDDNEQGISDVVVTVGRETQLDSITKKAKKQRGRFAAAEMITDNYGQVMYYRIPQGESVLNLYPLLNLKDLFNVNGQTQKVNIFRDTTIYVPFSQSYRVVGRIILNRDEFSSAGMISVSTVRITATDSLGNSFPALTTNDGSYTLYVPQAGEYKVRVNNVFGDRFVLQESEYTVSFDGAKEFQVDFIFNEKKRQININGSTTTGSVAPPNSPGPAAPPQPVNTGTATASSPVLPVRDTASTSAIPAPSTDAAVTYRIQLGASAVKIPESQYAVKFKGADNIKEYVQNGTYKYTAGDFKTWEFDQATEYKDKLIALGYKDAFVAFFKDGKRIK